MSDWTRGDDPIYDGYREYWQAQQEAENIESDRALAAHEPKGEPHELG